MLGDNGSGTDDAAGADPREVEDDGPGADEAAVLDDTSLEVNVVPDDAVAADRARAELGASAAIIAVAVA